MCTSFNRPNFYLSVLLASSALTWASAQATAAPLVYKGNTKLSTQKPLPPMPHIVQPRVEKQPAQKLPPSQLIQAIEDGEQSGIRIFQAVVIQDKASFNFLWSRHKPGHAAPEVDFDKYTVLAVFDGQKNLAGNKVQITSIRKSPGGADVIYRVTNAGKGEPNAMVNVQPYQIVKTAKITGSIAFSRE